MDRISPERRSALMSRIRNRDTRIELQVRRGLHALGLRFRLGGQGLPGRPDLVLGGWRTVVFVHGCFWHGHSCHLYRLPKTRTEFWSAKIESNRQRDVRVAARLHELGWTVETVWECQLRGVSDEAVAAVIAGLAERIRSNRPRERQSSG